MKTLLCLALVCLCSRTDDALIQLALESELLRPLVRTDAARALLDAVPELPAATPTTVYYRPGGGYLAPAFTRAEYEALDADEQSGLREVAVDTERYYSTFYGSPLVSVRAFDLAAQHGIESYDGRRVLDFGFGSIGQLRLLAACGADVTGTEVMPLLKAIYAAEREPRMVFGRWPAEDDVVRRVGRGYDLFVSKNTIKRGYVNPVEEVDPKQRLDFGVEQGVFLDRLHDLLNPGGLALIYNIGGAPRRPDGSYNPAADIASPWPVETYERHGFQVVAIDVDDSETIRAYARALGWDKGDNPMDLENALFARFTLLRRPR
ncbi:MAG: methyltransferase domain-containing protein [Planctomycetota bacterium]|jgi:hypothetical protein